MWFTLRQENHFSNGWSSASRLETRKSCRIRIWPSWLTPLLLRHLLRAHRWAVSTFYPPFFVWWSLFCFSCSDQRHISQHAQTKHQEKEKQARNQRGLSQGGPREKSSKWEADRGSGSPEPDVLDARAAKPVAGDAQWRAAAVRPGLAQAKSWWQVLCGGRCFWERISGLKHVGQ